jgi:hypothetical protein
MCSITSHFGPRRGGAGGAGTTSTAALLSGALLVALNGCASRTARIPANPAPAAGPRYYVDLEPGWRLRVVTPILKSGGYKPKLEGEPGATTLKTGADFLGYEIAHYAVEARSRSGERLVFTAAEVHNKDGVVAAVRPIVPLFRLPDKARYVRLIYLVRVSEADHDMAVVAANKRDALDPLTARVRAHPETCRSRRGIFCAWIPDGIAVTPEMRDTAAGAEQWAPAR